MVNFVIGLWSSLGGADLRLGVIQAGIEKMGARVVDVHLTNRHMVLHLATASRVYQKGCVQLEVSDDFSSNSE